MLEQFVIGLPGKITSTLVANLKKKNYFIMWWLPVLHRYNNTLQLISINSQHLCNLCMTSEQKNNAALPRRFEFKWRKNYFCFKMFFFFLLLKKWHNVKKVKSASPRGPWLSYSETGTSNLTFAAIFCVYVRSQKIATLVTSARPRILCFKSFFSSILIFFYGVTMETE